MSVETYKGINFVRISQLPEDQKTQITQTIDQHKIIKILRGKELLPDCVQANDYDLWVRHSYNKTFKTAQEQAANGGSAIFPKATSK
jgi:hypothetical protein